MKGRRMEGETGRLEEEKNFKRKLKVFIFLVAVEGSFINITTNKHTKMQKKKKINPAVLHLKTQGRDEGRR